MPTQISRETVHTYGCTYGCALFCRQVKQYNRRQLLADAYTSTYRYRYTAINYYMIYSYKVVTQCTKLVLLAGPKCFFSSGMVAYGESRNRALFLRNQLRMKRRHSKDLNSCITMSVCNKTIARVATSYVQRCRL